QTVWSEWDEIVLGGLAHLIDFHSIHLYTGSADHYTTGFSSHQAERAVRICAAPVERVRAAHGITHPIHIACEEWNVWWRTRSHEDRVGGVEERYTLTDALAVATYLNGFIRHCDTVKIANLAQLVNAIAPVFTSPTGLFLQTIYHPLRLYAEHTREIGLDVHVSGETYALAPAQETGSEGRVHHVAELGPCTLRRCRPAGEVGRGGPRRGPRPPGHHRRGRRVGGRGPRDRRGERPRRARDEHLPAAPRGLLH